MAAPPHFDDLQHFTWTSRASLCDDLLAVMDSIAKGVLLDRVWVVLSHLADGRDRDAFEQRLLEHAERGIVDDLALDTLVRLGSGLDGERARLVLRAVNSAPQHDRWRNRIVALAEISSDERIVTEALDGLSKELLVSLLGASHVGAAALARWLPLANPNEPADIAALGFALPAPQAARVLYGRRSAQWPALSPQQLEHRPPHVVDALWAHASTLAPVLREHPELEAVALSAFALPAPYMLADIGESALRAIIQRAIDELRRDDELRNARNLPATARRVVRFAAHWSVGRDLVVAILNDGALGMALRTAAYQELATASPVDAHAWAFRAPWDALVTAARVARLASLRHGDIDARGTEEVGRALVDPSPSVRHRSQWVVESRPDGLGLWRNAIDADRGSPWALRVLARRGTAAVRRDALTALAHAWEQGRPSSQERSLCLLIEHDGRWRDTCEAHLRQPASTTAHRHTKHAAANALARIGDDDARTRLLRVSLDPACSCVADRLAPRWE